MKVNRQELLNALEVVKPGLANKEMIEQSTSFAFHDNRVITYNDEISISHPVKSLDVTGAIKAEELYKLLNRFAVDEINIEVTDTEVIIQAAKAKAGFTFQKEILLPIEDIRDVDGWVDVPDGIIEAIRFCLFSCSNNMSRPVLTCVHFKQGGIVESCDNYRLTRYNIGKELPFDDVLIPANTANKLVQYELSQVAEGNGWLHFRSKEGTIFSCRTVAGNYPDLSSFIDIEGKVIVFPESINDILSRACVFDQTDFSSDRFVDVHFGSKRSYICTKGSSGWFEEDIDMEYSGKPVDFHVNPVFLQDICKKVRVCYIAENVIKFVGDNWVHSIALIQRKEF